LAARLTPPGVAVLRYHSVQDDPSTLADSIGRGITLATASFEEQMSLLARRFNPVTLDDIHDFLAGNKTLPPRPVAVTFDDGYADNSEIAAPILERYGVCGAFYVTVNAVEAAHPPWFCRLRHAFAKARRSTWTDARTEKVRSLESAADRRAAFLTACERCASLAGAAQTEALAKIEKELEVEPLAPRQSLMLSWNQVRRLRAAGHLIGSHTLTHPNLAQVGQAAMRSELADSKLRLEQELCAPVIHFSYPSPILQPHWTPATRGATEEIGYRTAVTCDAGPVRRGHDPLSLRRVSVPEDKQEFLWQVECTLLGRRM
jgi:peptidoglycan/xylan/chitin deacetylase (PgdA/CDA1 family)